MNLAQRLPASMSEEYGWYLVRLENDSKITDTIASPSEWY